MLGRGSAFARGKLTARFTGGTPVAFLALLFVLMIIFVAFKLTGALDRRDEKRKGGFGKNTPRSKR